MRTLIFAILLAIILVLSFLCNSCKPPQTTEVHKIDTLFISHTDTLFSEDNGLNSGVATIETTITDTILKEGVCPPQFPRLRHVRNFTPVTNSFNNSRFDSAITVIGELRKGTTGNGSVKPTTNIGYTTKQLILPTLISWLVFLVIGFISGYYVKSKSKI